MYSFVEMVLSGVGAGLILAALTFVTLLIGVLVNAMVALFAGPVIDKVLARKSAARVYVVRAAAKSLPADGDLAAAVVVLNSPSSTLTTCLIGRPYLRAKAKSRSS